MSRGSRFTSSRFVMVIAAGLALAMMVVAVLRAVNLGDDADTTGAVCGQLAGA